MAFLQRRGLTGTSYRKYPKIGTLAVFQWSDSGTRYGTNGNTPSFFKQSSITKQSNRTIVSDKTVPSTLCFFYYSHILSCLFVCLCETLLFESELGMGLITATSRCLRAGSCFERREKKGRT